MLAIIRYIKTHGLAKAIETFKLKTRVYEKKILLKYDQIESNMSFEEVQDCRGLILERDTWKVMSMSFRKFFNHGEGNAATIDWNTARVLEKVDGTMIQLYWDWHKNETMEAIIRIMMSGLLNLERNSRRSVRRLSSARIFLPKWLSRW
jgi:hypothetical protein